MLRTLASFSVGFYGGAYARHHNNVCIIFPWVYLVWICTGHLIPPDAQTRNSSRKYHQTYPPPPLPPSAFLQRILLDTNNDDDFSSFNPLDPLIIGQSGGGHDVFYCTPDGSVGGLLGIQGNYPQTPVEQWKLFHHRQAYLASPVAFPLTWTEREEDGRRIVFSSEDGVFDIFTSQGRLLNSVKIPPIYLNRSWILSPTSDKQDLSAFLRFSETSTNGEIDDNFLLLLPRILATPTISPNLEGTHSDEFGLIVSVTYHNKDDVILAALVVVGRCILLPDQPHCSKLKISSSLSPAFCIVPLEATRKSKDNHPAYLLASPAVHLEMTSSTGIIKQILNVPSGSGRLHWIPSALILNHSILGESSSFVKYKSNVLTLNASFATQCQTVDYIIRDAATGTCCLLVDVEHSKVVLIAGNTNSVIWSHQLPRSLKSTSFFDLKSFILPGPSDLLAVFVDDSSRLVHVLSLETGQALSGSPFPYPPAKLERSTSSFWKSLLLSSDYDSIYENQKANLPFYVYDGNVRRARLFLLRLPQLGGSASLVESGEITPFPTQFHFQSSECNNNSLHTSSYLIDCRKPDFILSQFSYDSGTSSCVNVKAFMMSSSNLNIKEFTLHITIRDCFASLASKNVTTYYVQVNGISGHPILPLRLKQCLPKSASLSVPAWMAECSMHLSVPSIEFGAARFSLTVISSTGRMLLSQASLVPLVRVQSTASLQWIFVLSLSPLLFFFIIFTTILPFSPDLPMV